MEDRMRRFATAEGWRSSQQALSQVPPPLFHNSAQLTGHVVFGQPTSSFEQLLNRPRRSAWREFLRAPCVFIARQIYVCQRRVPAEPLANPVSVVCISDTHDSQPTVPDGHVLVHAGHLTQSGTFGELQSTLSWLSSLPHKHKIVVGGNHDILLDVRRDDPAGQAGSRRGQLAWGDIIYLNDESTIVACSNGRRLNVYGSPKSPKHGNWAFQYLRSEDVWTGKMPQDLDILVTHGPPRAHLDLLNLGCVHLLRELWRTQQVLHVFGHVHEGYGSDWLNFDNIQQAYERVVISKGGMFNLLRVVKELIQSLFTPVKEARCRLYGGLQNQRRRIKLAVPKAYQPTCSDTPHPPNREPELHALECHLGITSCSVVAASLQPLRSSHHRQGRPSMPAPPSLPAGGDAPESSGKDDPGVVEVAEDGDVVLDVTFETSPETLKKSRQAALAANGGKLNPQPSPPGALKPTVKVAYRVSVAVLKRHSQYFSNLVSSPRFREAKLIDDTHKMLAARGVKPADADARDLPFIAIVDDDQATQAAGREHIFEDMLLIAHQKPPKTAKVDLSYAVTIAILADRFDCVGTVARSLNKELKFKWPLTNNRPFFDDRGRMTDVENVLRQKILSSWLLGQPMRLQQSTRELVIRGSSLWGAFHDDVEANTTAAAWWNLPEGIEQELRYRRECILDAIASIQRHFLDLYASRERQCKLGYDTSTACDAFQLGQLLKFLRSKELLFLVDYSPASLDAVPDTSQVDIEDLVANLKQCPNYQVDKHHTNCGPHLRIKAIMDYLRTMLSANVIWISHSDWKKRRAEVSWEAVKKSNRARDESGRAFAFTRAIANDQRLRYEGVLHADRMAMSLFTADTWDWTPEA
ncbi:Uncharacterized protein TPAR_00581 [Tolypocladium paradoxum]|uniref:Uncharacterized protein n=1 Tax=Tolypocladium paradoxum TaxID=94208 RepID=A0A2S4L9V9_9HYPO|nr:Uncharacterized protein TPAR_00581 [Tolypocladium paradoxum]